MTIKGDENILISPPCLGSVGWIDDCLSEPTPGLDRRQVSARFVVDVQANSIIRFSPSRIIPHTLPLTPYGTLVKVSTSLIAYLFTAWSRDFLEKLTGSQIVKKFPSIYGTRRFITAFTIARHLSLS